MEPKLKVGFIGAGKMATALAQGLVRAGVTTADRMIGSDVSEAALHAFGKVVGARTTGFNPEVAKFAEVLVIAVKPAQVTDALAELRRCLTEKHLSISIAAGIPLAKLQAALGDGARVIRVMPNTPALVGASATAIALGDFATPEDGELAKNLFSSVGTAYVLKESLLDAVTGLSGSGPAYVYMFIEALSDGGVAAGLPRDLALSLAAQTVLGGARMVLDTGMHRGSLKDMVASPGGTTIEGIHELEKGKFRATVINAVRAAADKARKMAG